MAYATWGSDYKQTRPEREAGGREDALDRRRTGEGRTGTVPGDQDIPYRRSESGRKEPRTSGGKLVPEAAPRKRWQDRVGPSWTWSEKEVADWRENSNVHFEVWINVYRDIGKSKVKYMKLRNSKVYHSEKMEGINQGIESEGEWEQSGNTGRRYRSRKYGEFSEQCR